MESLKIKKRIFSILKYKDPSTGRVYVSAIPDYEIDDNGLPIKQEWKRIEKADQAMAWKFHLTEKEYSLLTLES